MATVDHPRITIEESYLCMLDEASKLGILPPQQDALQYFGFHGIYHGDNVEDLYRLWKIYMRLIYGHGRSTRDIVDWCRNGIFAVHAAGSLEGYPDDCQWLMQRQSVLKPWRGDPWTEPAKVWYRCAMMCFDSVDIQWNLDPNLREKQKCYLAFGVFNLKGHPNPKWITPDINVWYDFGFATCAWEKDRMELSATYHRAIQETSFNIGIPQSQAWSPRFDLFWGKYSSGNLVSWIDLFTTFNCEEKFPWLKKFLPKPAGSELEDVKDWSVWRLCQIFELETPNTTNLPEPFQVALRYYGIWDSPYTQERLLRIYQRVAKHGGLGELHMARQSAHLLEFATHVSNRLQQSEPIERWVQERFGHLDYNITTGIPTNRNMNAVPNRGSGIGVMSIANLNNPRRERHGMPLNDMLNPDPST